MEVKRCQPCSEQFIQLYQLLSLLFRGALSHANIRRVPAFPSDFQGTKIFPPMQGMPGKPGVFPFSLGHFFSEQLTLSHFLGKDSDGPIHAAYIPLSTSISPLLSTFFFSLSPSLLYFGRLNSQVLSWACIKFPFSVSEYWGSNIAYLSPRSGGCKV